MKTAYQLKVEAAAECIAENRSHVAPNGAACYPNRDAADEASRRTMSAMLDTAEIEAAYTMANRWERE